jgi:hypothetical protein
MLALVGTIAVVIIIIMDKEGFGPEWKHGLELRSVGQGDIIY